MSTYNALSVPNYHKLVEGVYGLKEKYGSSDRYWNSAVFLDSSYLRFPSHQTVQVLPDKWTKNIFEQAQLADYLSIPSFEHKYVGYSDIEVQKIKRIYDWMNADVDEKHLKTSMQNFYRYFNAHDERRNTNFINTFPELEEFYYDTVNDKRLNERTRESLEQFFDYQLADIKDKAMDIQDETQNSIDDFVEQFNLTKEV